MLGTYVRGWVCLCCWCRAGGIYTVCCRFANTGKGSVVLLVQYPSSVEWELATDLLELSTLIAQ